MGKSLESGIVAVREIRRVAKAGEPFHVCEAVVSGQEHAVSRAVQTVDCEDRTAEDLLSRLGGLGELDFDVRGARVLRCSGRRAERHRALHRVEALYRDALACDVVLRRGRDVRVNAGHVELKRRARAVRNEAVAPPLGDHVDLLVGLAAACRLALIARQRAVRRIVRDALYTRPVIDEVFRAGEQIQLAVQIKPLRPAAALQAGHQRLLTARDRLIGVRVQTHLVQGVSGVDDHGSAGLGRGLVEENTGDRLVFAEVQHCAPAPPPFGRAALVRDNVHRARTAAVVDLGLVGTVVHAAKLFVALPADGRRGEVGNRHGFHSALSSLSYANTAGAASSSASTK